MQKDTQNSEEVQAVGAVHSPMSFISDMSLGKICRKVTKITKAVCLVVSHVEHSKDIRKRVEGLAYDLSDITISLLYKSTEEQFKDKQIIFAKCISLVNFIELLDSLHLVSDTNAHILNGQIKLFMEDVSNFKGVSDTAHEISAVKKVGPSEESVASIFFDATENIDEVNQGTFSTDNSYLENSIVDSNNYKENRPIVAPALNQNINSKYDKVDSTKQNQNTATRSKVVEVLSPAIQREQGNVRVTRSSFHPTNAEFRQRLANAKTLEDLHGISVESASESKKVTPIENMTYTSTGGSISGSSISKGTIGNSEYLQPKTERQELIVKTIASKGELSIKDLEGVVKGCSEKTIQRELLSLVELGILQKSGERRWSRYSLAR